ncbi:MAG: thioredoxin family protein [archaeon]
MNFSRLAIIFLMILACSNIVQAENMTVYFFYGDGCPHCAQEEPFLAELANKYPITIESYEVWYNSSNAAILGKKLESLGKNSKGVPTTIFNEKVWVGFSDPIARDIENEIQNCVDLGCVIAAKNHTDSSAQESKVVEIPVLGKINVAEMGLFTFTVVMGILDGFNACAMWVLCFLLSLLIYSRSRKHVFIVGGTFIFISGLVYFLFMAAWMNAFIFAGHLKIIQISISALAIVFGIINIKDYFAFGKGVSLTIPAGKKPKIAEKMRKLVNPETGFFLTLIGVAGLAFMVNLIELLCTAGFPAIYTNILAQYKLPWYSNYLYLLLYILMYMIDDIIIFTVVVLTMTSKRFTEKYGRISKLISGIVILLLGIIMLINPNLLMLS